MYQLKIIRFFFVNADGHLFNLYYSMCENLNPPCQNIDSSLCIPIESCINMYRLNEFNSNSNNLSFIISPNPVNDFFTIYNIPISAIDEWFIRDINGKIVLTGNSINNNIINVAILSQGIYTFSVIENSNIHIQKFIKN